MRVVIYTSLGPFSWEANVFKWLWRLVKDWIKKRVAYW